MKFQEKISFPVSIDDKSFIYEKAKETRQTVSGFIRSRLFDHIDFRKEDQRKLSQQKKQLSVTQDQTLMNNVVVLDNQGKTQHAIAKELGFSQAKVSRLLKRYKYEKKYRSDGD